MSSVAVAVAVVIVVVDVVVVVVVVLDVVPRYRCLVWSRRWLGR